MNYLQNLTNIVFQEIPNETSLLIYFTGCKNDCINCHTPEAKDPNNGIKFNYEDLLLLIKKYKNNISCILFMGGDWEKSFLDILINLKTDFKDLKLALYSGNDFLDIKIMQYLDYVKLGGYFESKGSITKKTTNQRLFRIENITSTIQK